MKLIEIDPRELSHNPWNSNIVSPENMVKLEESLRRNGWVKPALARQTNKGFEILGGQHRVEAAIALGHESVPIINLGEMTDLKAKEIGLIDNARYGSDDAISLAEILEEISVDTNASIFLPFDESDLASLGTDMDVDIDDLLDESNDDDESEIRPDKKTARTHAVMRFKIPVEDEDDVSDLFSAIQREQDFTSGDSLSNAGDALVWVAHKLKSEGLS